MIDKILIDFSNHSVFSPHFLNFGVHSSHVFGIFFCHKDLKQTHNLCLSIWPKDVYRRGSAPPRPEPTPQPLELRAFTSFSNLKQKSKEHKKELVCPLFTELRRCIREPEPPWHKSEWKIYLECTFILIGWALSGIAK